MLVLDCSTQTPKKRSNKRNSSAKSTSTSAPHTPMKDIKDIKKLMLEKPVCPSDTNNNNNKASAYNNQPASKIIQSNDPQQQSKPTLIKSLSSSLPCDQLFDINFHHCKVSNKGTSVNFNHNFEKNCKNKNLVFSGQFDGSEEFLLATESWHKAKNWTSCSSRKDSLATAVVALNSSTNLLNGEFLIL